MSEVSSIETPVSGGDIDRDSLSERVYARLRLALMSGQYEPGAKLNIRGLAAAYEMSPTPVREAVFQLVREGALELRLGHQPRVPTLSLPRYINIRETRAPLERLAAELATVRLPDTEIPNLREAHLRFVQSEKEGRWKDALAANQSFHFTIYRACENDVLIHVIGNLWLLAGPFVNNQYPLHRPPDRGIHPHLLIIDALERRSPGEVGELIVRDLREGSLMILEKLQAEAAARRTAPRRSRSPAS